MEKLKLQQSNHPIGQSFDVIKNFQAVPSFQEDNVDIFFLHFEKLATNLNWPKDHWTILLQKAFVGKAREIFAQLSVEQSQKYEYVKDVVLRGYQLNPEAYRQKFRNCQRDISQTFVEFARVKEQLFDRWCLSKKVNKDFEKLRQLILIEEFKRLIPFHMKTFIDEKQVENLEQAADLADEYFLTHGNFNQQRSQSSDNQYTANPSSGSDAFQQPVNSTQSIKSNSETSAPFCNYCKRRGHLKSECFYLTGKQLSRPDVQQPSPSGHIASIQFVSDSLSTVLMPCETVTASSNRDRILEMFEPFIQNGFVSLSDDFSEAKPIRILRDTGSAQSILLESTLPFSDSTYSGAKVLLKGVDTIPGSYPSASLHQVYLSSSHVNGQVTVGIQSSLPVDGIDFLLGNDLAGDKVILNPLVTDTPCVYQQQDPVEVEVPNLYPACAVTRAMRRKEQENDFDISLEDTFMVNDDSQDDTPMIDITSDDPTQFIRQQENDPDIKALIQRAVAEDESLTEPVCFYIKNGILMRRWRPPDVPANAKWAVHSQVVVPKPYRLQILSMAHETPLADHLGITKTYDKILQHFYWPELKKDVTQFCRSCHTCQMIGKPNQTIPKANLQPIPAFQEPFSRILVDCVGPLPKTKTGNQYMLTIMCASTRFPEAIPLRNINAKTIIKALTKFFTLVGLPKAVQSDQGSNFMSGIYTQVMHELGINQYKSSAYHPESQGALERFHQTLKNMIRAYCFDTEKCWDQGVHFLLFAVRESVQESTGFSPFQLVFGHAVRGPLKLLKEKILCEEDKPLNLLQYVTEFKAKLAKACELARSNLISAQKIMKQRYDKKTVERKFQPGDKVLVLLPIPGSPLQARFSGPYEVEEKIGDLNYVLRTPDRRKHKQLCHVNMLKTYEDREHVPVHPVTVIQPKPANLESDIDVTEVPVKLNNSEILQNIQTKLMHLKQSERDDIDHLL